ncbi:MULTISPECIES: UPF0149 family protein [Alteromonadaceae]|uniref:UPF0149 family protein n=1 Tax=Alteromonadaceae TaxID=72275 RepID=UPI001C0964B4|nr:MULTISPECIES: UPF0149 family protein [Aliiglaciecola]MBU2876899.1 UPF0149 family protein [Aliiglaciecola lipolytica]MDO6712589.1 UPF0149 family protein [Aliiglaciecola sp. 2_MG-2023]MDO6753803.1 UPF0149 family protein [Aliiglaciecola sp. 1_MG-2023]
MNPSHLNYEELSTLLEQHNILTDASEVHGIFCGMLSGGMALESQEWSVALNDSINQGDALPNEVQVQLTALYNDTCQQLLETDFTLTLCMPDDSAPINERGKALINWIQGFMLGFGLHQADLTACSADVKEALEDFYEISRMDETMPENEEAEKALFEVIEYVRVSCMLCFNELGHSADQAQTEPKTVH